MTRVLSIIGGNTIYGKEVVGLKVLSVMKDNNIQLLNISNGWNDGLFIKELERIGVACKTFKLGWIYLTKPLWTLNTLIHLPVALAKFYFIKRSFKPHLIYTDSYRALVFLYPFLRNQSVVWHVHDGHAGNETEVKFIKLVQQKIKTFIAVSAFIKDDLLKCGIPEEKIAVVYNPVEDPGLKVNVETAGTTLRIAIIGQILAIKGHEDLIDALILLKNKIDFRLDIVGTGDEEFIARIKQKISENNFDGFVHWHGYVKDVSSIYNKIDILVVPTRRDEPFGLVAAEAGSYGLPVIVTDSGGLKEIVVDGITGFIVPKQDPAAIAQSLHTLYRNPGLRMEMGAKARANVASKFFTGIFGKKIIELIS